MRPVLVILGFVATSALSTVGSPSREREQPRCDAPVAEPDCEQPWRPLGQEPRNCDAVGHTEQEPRRCSDRVRPASVRERRHGPVEKRRCRAKDREPRPRDGDRVGHGEGDTDRKTRIDAATAGTEADGPPSDSEPVTPIALVRFVMREEVLPSARETGTEFGRAGARSLVGGRSDGGSVSLRGTAGETPRRFSRGR